MHACNIYIYIYVCVCVILCRGTWITQLIQRRTTGWTAEESRFGSRQGQEVFLLSTAARPVTGPIQARFQCLLGVKRPDMKLTICYWN
jgi:hypothetical protein